MKSFSRIASLQDYEAQILKQKEGSFLHKRLSQDIANTRVAIREKDFIVSVASGILSNYQGSYASVLPLDITTKPSDHDFVVIGQELVNLNTDLATDKVLRHTLPAIDLSREDSKEIKAAIQNSLTTLNSVSVSVGAVHQDLLKSDLEASQRLIIEKMDAQYAKQLQFEELIKPLQEVMGESSGVLEYIATEVARMTQLNR